MSSRAVGKQAVWQILCHSHIANFVPDLTVNLHHMTPSQLHLVSCLVMIAVQQTAWIFYIGETANK